VTEICRCSELRKYISFVHFVGFSLTNLESLFFEVIYSVRWDIILFVKPKTCTYQIKTLKLHIFMEISGFIISLFFFQFLFIYLFVYIALPHFIFVFAFFFFFLSYLSLSFLSYLSGSLLSQMHGMCRRCFQGRRKSKHHAMQYFFRRGLFSINITYKLSSIKF
jgi:hypothetical protein